MHACQDQGGSGWRNRNMCLPPADSVTVQFGSLSLNAALTLSSACFINRPKKTTTCIWDFFFTSEAAVLLSHLTVSLQSVCVSVSVWEGLFVQDLEVIMTTLFILENISAPLHYHFLLLYNFFTNVLLFMLFCWIRCVCQKCWAKFGFFSGIPVQGSDLDVHSWPIIGAVSNWEIMCHRGYLFSQYLATVHSAKCWMCWLNVDTDGKVIELQMWHSLLS